MNERPPLRTVELYFQHFHVFWANQLLDLHSTVPLKVLVLLGQNLKVFISINDLVNAESNKV